MSSCCSLWRNSTTEFSDSWSFGFQAHQFQIWLCCLLCGRGLFIGFPVLRDGDNEKRLTELWVQGRHDCRVSLGVRTWGQMAAEAGKAWNVRSFVQRNQPFSPSRCWGQETFCSSWVIAQVFRRCRTGSWLRSLLVCGERASRCEGSWQVPPLKEVAANWACQLLPHRIHFLWGSI